MLAWRYRRAVIWRLPVLLPLIILATAATAAPAADRPRFRDAGFAVGALPAGPGNAITDVPGVRVGQVT